MGLFKILLVLVLPLFSQEVRDRKEINDTLLEEKTRSDLEDFSAAEGFSPLCKEKSSGDEWDFPSRSVAFIPLRPLSEHCLFLMQQNKVVEAIDQYRLQSKGQHYFDFDLLKQMGHILLQNGVASDDPKILTATLLGAGFSGSMHQLEILEKGLDFP